VTKRRTAEFHVLGQLEMVVAGETVSLGGAKQRAVLAVLLLRSGEVVPLERLVDEVWGGSPPPSAAHSVEAYVSRLRQILGGSGTTLIRRGAGYALLLGDATLDALEFERLTEDGWNAAAEGRFQDASSLAARALALWRGPALADVGLASSGRTEAERLEELRLRALELLFDAELALGRHDSIVGRVQALVGENPYRERFVSQLMLALYRCGRQADALEAYEQLRRRLDEDLGLQPSEELQQLSAQIVRQEPQLRRPRPSQAGEMSPAGAAASHRTRRLSGLVLVGAVVAATLTLSANGGAPAPEADTVVPTRIALLQASGSDAVHADRVSLAFRTSAKAYGYDYEELALDESGSRIEADERLRRSVESGRYALVLAADAATARAVRPLVPKNPARAFVFMDMSLRDVGLAGVPNASAFRFRDEQSSRLAGYLSALVHPRLGARGTRVDSVLVVAGPSTPHVERIVRGYVEGVRHAKRPIRVRIVRSKGTDDVTECERIANEQIDTGIDVVFAAAGRCGLGAIATARVRGVWGIGEQEVGAELTSGALAVTTKDWSLAVFRTIQSFEGGVLPLGRDEALGLEDDYMVMIETGVSERVFSKIAALCSTIRLAAETGA
jgi:DNA-binding SARP family transcriptional activator/basic membrane lipoprotein Med (substrate-binding protein (PBP1-ABC) superfamily)